MKEKTTFSKTFLYARYHIEIRINLDFPLQFNNFFPDNIQILIDFDHTNGE